MDLNSERRSFTVVLTSRAILLHSPKLRNLYPNRWKYCLVSQDAVLACRLLHPIPETSDSSFPGENFLLSVLSSEGKSGKKGCLSNSHTFMCLGLFYMSAWSIVGNTRFIWSLCLYPLMIASWSSVNRSSLKMPSYLVKALFSVC